MYCCTRLVSFGGCMYAACMRRIATSVRDHCSQQQKRQCCQRSRPPSWQHLQRAADTRSACACVCVCLAPLQTRQCVLAPGDVRDRHLNSSTNCENAPDLPPPAAAPSLDRSRTSALFCWSSSPWFVKSVFSRCLLVNARGIPPSPQNTIV